MRVRKNIYYFSSFDEARQYAVDFGWPIDRIIRYELGWAIQRHVSGPYVGPSNAGERTHARLMSQRLAR